MAEANQYVVLSEEITFGKLWDKSTALKGHLGGFWGAYILTFILATICCALLSLVPVIGGLLGGAIGYVFYLGPVIYALYAVQNKPLELGVAFKPCNKFSNFFVVYILITLFTFLWSLLLIIPGIIAAIRYILTPFIMFDNPEMSPSDAIKESCKLMDGFKLKYFGYSLLWSLIIGFFGTITLGIALIWLIPKATVFMASFYESVKAAKATAAITAE